MTPQITVAAPPATADVLESVLAMMAALSGAPTDYNPGSQIRTMMESVGASIEQQGIGDLTLVTQGIAVGALSLFSISTAPAMQAVGVVTFSTSLAQNPPPATQAVQIPAGTIVQTAGGVQFQTTELVILPQGAISVTAPVQAVKGGSLGNVAIGAISQILTGLAYPLVVSNAAPTAGGSDAQSPSQSFSTLASKVASLVGGSPVSIANGAIGVAAAGSAERVVYATVYEPWIAAGNGPGSTTAGWSLYIDNGSGSASQALIAAVKSYVDGDAAQQLVGNRPSGVPYQILAVQPVFANVSVTASVNPLLTTAPVSGAIDTAIDAYFSGLQFGIPAEQPQISAQVSNAAAGALTSLSVQLFYAASPSAAVNEVSGLAFNRVVLSSLTIDLSSG